MSTFIFGGPLDYKCLPKWPAKEKRLGITYIIGNLSKVINHDDYTLVLIKPLKI